MLKSSEGVKPETEASFSSFCFGRVFHKRMRPKVHAFEYKMFMPLLDVDDIKHMQVQYPWFLRFPYIVNINRPALYAFYENDYLKNSLIESENLKSRALRVLNEMLNIDLSQHANIKILVLSQWRFLGRVFNPISIYYVLVDGEYRYILAEVSNTPWHERKVYAYPLVHNGEIETWKDDKSFHVSPFNPMDMTYHWRTAINDKTVALHLLLTQQTHSHFEASFYYQRVAFTFKNFMKGVMAKPFFSFHTVFGIYWQALKLFIKRIPIYDHPK